MNSARCRRWIGCLAGACVLVLAAPAAAHVNSPHIFISEPVGPYPAMVVGQMPPAVPGEATVHVILEDLKPGEQVRVWVQEIPPQGETHAPPPVEAEPSRRDPRLFSAPVSLMVYGLYHAKVRVEGERGRGVTDFPIPARRPVPRTMDTGLSYTLLGLVGLLFASLWQILSSLGREAHRPPGAAPTPKDRRRGRRWAVTGVVAFGLFLSFTGMNWALFNQIHTALSGPLYRAEMRAGPAPVAGRTTRLEIVVRDRNGDPPADLVPDHDKMMHVVGVRSPGADAFYHFHPAMTSPGRFVASFTPLHPGRHVFFGDLLFANGEAETVVMTLDVAPGPGGATPVFDDPDDSYALQPPFGDLEPGRRTWPAGGRLVIRWSDPPPGPIRPGDFLKLRFVLEDETGAPVEGIEPYMGMAGHLLILRDDFNVFAHVHPMGTLSGRMQRTMQGMAHHAHALPPEVSFPYGFPEPGRYRLWAQMKHEGRIYTGVFDAVVD